MKAYGTATLLLCVGFFTTPNGRAQTPNWHSFHPVSNDKCQTAFGADAQSDRTIGINVTPSKASDSLRVTFVVPDGPADVAGIRKGDLLWGTSPTGEPIPIDACQLLQQEKSNTSVLDLYHAASNEMAPARVAVKSRMRRDVSPGESRLAWNIVAQLLDGGRFETAAALSQGPEGDFELKLSVENRTTDTLLQLDGEKTSCSTAKARSSLNIVMWTGNIPWKRSWPKPRLLPRDESVPYVAPDATAPATHYRITGTSTGSYELTPLTGDTFNITGQSQLDYRVDPVYTPREQAGQAAGTIAAIVEDIRIARANKQIKKLRQRAAANSDTLRRLIADGTTAHFDTTAPVAPGAVRIGSVAFYSGHASDSNLIRAVYVIHDTASKRTIS